MRVFAIVLVGCGYGVPAPNTWDDDDDEIVPFSSGTTTPGPGGPLQISEVDVEVHEDITSILVVTWEQSAAATTHLEFSWDVGVWHASPDVSREAGTQEELILGAPYESNVTFRIVATDGNDTVTTPDDLVGNGKKPVDLPSPIVIASNPALMDTTGAPYFFAGIPGPGQSWAGAPWWAVIIDREGRFVWAVESPPERSFMHARVALDGKSLYLDHQSYWPTFDEGEAAEIEQTAIDGTVLHTFDTPGMHHPFTDMPDGSVAYGMTTDSYFNEHIVIVHRDGTTEDIFACEDWLDEIGVFAFCASNTLAYHEPTNKFLFSHYPFGTIIEVDRTTGQVDRWWGQAETPWVFDPADSGFYWQHGGHITSTGTLLTSTDYDGPSGVETVVREYEIDDATKTLHEVANYGVGEGLYGGVMGEAFYLPNGNVLHNTGGVARIREYTPSGEVVWDILLNAGAIGRSMPIADLYALKAP
jgi:hypothetical protein